MAPSILWNVDNLLQQITSIFKMLPVLCRSEKGRVNVEKNKASLSAFLYNTCGQLHAGTVAEMMVTMVTFSQG